MTPPHSFAPRRRLQRAAQLAGLASLLWLAACATPGGPAASRSTPATAAVAAPVAVAPAPVPAAAPTQAVRPVVVAAAPAGAAQPAEGEPTAEMLQPIDPLRPDVRVNVDDGLARTDLWARVRRGFAMPDLDNDNVRKWEQWYSARPDYVARMTERGGRYLFHIVEEVEKRGMPAELALLPFIESAYNPQAMSSARASGMWQFIPTTGRDYALKQNIFRDDRRDVLASTRAALDYLQTLGKMFNGDWQLALAAYNWGQGNVQRAVARNTKAGESAAYDALRMPDETRNYLPKLQAVKNLVARPEAFGVALAPLANHPYFLSVPIARDIDVDLAARLAGLPLDEFRQLNPQMNKPVVLAAGTPQVLLPYDNANQFLRGLSHHKGQLASWTAWVAPSTMKPAAVARNVGMSEEQLRSVNRIPPRMLVKAGSTLLVPRGAQRQDNVAEHIADNAVLALAPDLPPMRRVSFKAGRRGTSVAAVARQYRVSAAHVAQWNRVSVGASFRPGQVVVVMVPIKGKATRMAKATRGGKAVRVAAAAPHRAVAKKSPGRSSPLTRVRVARR